MPLLTSAMLGAVAKSALCAAVNPFLADAKEIALSAARDAIRDTLTGGMSLEEWANVIAEAADRTKDSCERGSELRFVGGEIKLAVSAVQDNSITASFHLYFLDARQKWQRTEAYTNIPSSRFSKDALEELTEKLEIKYAVE